LRGAQAWRALLPARHLSDRGRRARAGPGARRAGRGGAAGGAGAGARRARAKQARLRPPADRRPATLGGGGGRMALRVIVEATPGRITLVARPGLRPFRLILGPRKAELALSTIRRFLPERPPARSKRSAGVLRRA